MKRKSTSKPSKNSYTCTCTINMVPKDTLHCNHALDPISLYVLYLINISKGVLRWGSGHWNAPITFRLIIIKMRGEKKNNKSRLCYKHAVNRVVFVKFNKAGLQIRTIIHGVNKHGRPTPLSRIITCLEGKDSLWR